MGTNLMRALLLTSASVVMVATAAPTVAYAQEATYQIDIPAQSMGDALRALGKATKQNIVFNGSLVKGKRSVAVRGRMSANDALVQLLARSGLKMSRGSGGGFVVQAGNGSATSANAGQPAGSSRVQSRGSISGTVTDESTGAALKGALVEIEGTRRRTATDDLGRYQFNDVPAGQATVRISYLGYAQSQVSFVVRPGEASEQDFSLVGGAAGQEIVVYGRRSARAQALNQEKTADNVSTVISSDSLGSFTGTTIAESLRRAPGVVFERDSATGDGTNIVVRGLAPDFNTIKLNGVELPESSGRGRAASLGNLLTESVGKVTISKTLLPSQDSSGTGGLIDIETKTPLDRPRRFASVTVEGAKRAKGFNDDFSAAATISGKFGASEQFGLSASVQYRKQDLKRVSYTASPFFGQYLPLQVDGQPTINNINQLNPTNPFPFEPGADEVYIGNLTIGRSESQSENLNINLSAAWQIADHSTLYFDYNRLDRSDSGYNSGLGVTTNVGYQSLPVLALGGQVRQALAYRSTRFTSITPSFSYTPDRKLETDSYSFRGETNVGKLHLKYLAGYAKGSEDSTLYQAGGSLTVRPTDSDFIAGAAHPVEGRIISPFARRLPGDDSFPTFLLDGSGFDLINNASLYRFSNGLITRSTGENRRYTAEFSARYDFGWGPLRYLEIGGAYEDSKSSDDSPLEGTNFDPNGTVLFPALGLSLSQGSLDDVGVNIGLNRASRASIVPFLLNGMASASSTCDPTCPAGTLLVQSPTTIDPRRLDQFTREREFAAYAQAALDLGKLEVIGGVRMTRVEVESYTLRGAEIFNPNFDYDFDFNAANSVLTAEKVTQTDFLPRVLANYRVKDNVVLRAGYYLSVARPQIGLLSQLSAITLYLDPFFGPNFSGNQPGLYVSKGNPDLRPAKTNNFDISAEYYDQDVGVIKLGAFYKETTNLLESNIDQGPGALADVLRILPDDPRMQDVVNNPSNYYIEIRVPTNNERKAHIWGFEASIEKQLTFMPGALAGLGIYANYTYTDSSKDQPVSWSFSPIVGANNQITGFETKNFIVPDVRYSGQAKHSGTAGLTYNKYGIDANLAYTWQSRRMSQFNPNNLSTFEEAFGTLDLRMEYRFKLGPSTFRLYAEGTDLLRGPHDAGLQSTMGADDGVTAKYFTGASYYGGRQVRVGLNASF